MKYLSCFVIFLSSLSVLGQDIKKFDIDGDDKLSDRELRAVYLVFVSTAKFSDYVNADGSLNEDLIVADVAEYKQKLLDRKHKGEVKEILVSDVKKDLGSDSSLTEFLSKLKLLVRASHEDVTIMDPAKGFDKAEAAVFSYSRNYLTNTYGFIAKGALIRPIPLNSGNEFADQLVPSVTFNRVKDAKDSTKNANTLVARLGYNVVLQGGEKVGAIFIKAFGSYATDFNFKSEIYAAELEGEIAWTSIGIGTYQKFTFLEYRFNIIPHAEYGVVKDNGIKETLVEDDPFFRAGAKGSIALRPAFLKSLEFTTSYTYLAGLKGSPDRFENFSQKANYALDSKKRFSLSLEYNKGKVPLTLDEIENLIIGIAIKL